MFSKNLNFKRLALLCLTVFIIAERTVVNARGIVRQPRLSDATCGKESKYWDALRTTYNSTTVSSVGLSTSIETFVPGRLNRTVTISPTSKCVNKAQGGSATFYGHRVNQDEDNAVAVLYDNNGIVVGMQTRFRQGEVLVPGNPYKFNEIPMYQEEYIDGLAYFVLTAYFVDPSIICADGRTPDDLNRLEGTGNALYFQNGPLPTDLVMASKNKQEAFALGFGDNECYSSMGYHSYLNVTQWKTDDCKSMPPVFLLYNECDGLIGFGYQWLGFSRSERFEHPSSFTLTSLVGAGKIPQCLTDAVDRSSGGPGVTSMHVYFVDRNPECPITSVISTVAQSVAQYLG